MKTKHRKTTTRHPARASKSQACAKGAIFASMVLLFFPLYLLAKARKARS